MLVILGATASGKSTLAVQLARRFNGEVISADSRQVYRGLDIGTAKITTREMRGVRHHLLDVADPRRRYSVARYIVQARRAIDGIARRRRLPIVCGGTGFYISALLGKETILDVPPNEKLRKRLAEKNARELFMMLKKIDPRRARTIDSKNPRRLIRAIEVARALGKVPVQKTRAATYNALKIGIRLPKEELKRRIRARISARMRRGMVAEAKRLHKNGLSWKRMEELGLEYRYLARYLQRKLAKVEMENRLETASWHYAKRQMTWFKRDKTIRWFSPSDRRITQAVKRFLSR